ncbi:MAG: WG repeat-containing protein [Phycisphaerae bacterium]|nr:WG repeat-containing protein [Phycisphaerae bacterium]
MKLWLLLFGVILSFCSCSPSVDAGRQPYPYWTKIDTSTLFRIHKELPPYGDGRFIDAKININGNIVKPGKIQVLNEAGQVVCEETVWPGEKITLDGPVSAKGPNGLWGFVDVHTGKFVIQPRYRSQQYFHEGLAIVPISKHRKRGIFDRRGRFCYIDITGKEVIPGPFKEADWFQGGIAVVYIDNKDKSLAGWRYIKKDGSFLNDSIYRSAGYFCEGLARVADRKSWLYGYIDRAGKQVIPCRYVCANHFSCGLAKIEAKDASGRHRKLGYINKKGESVIPPQRCTATDFSGGLARLTTTTKGAEGKWIEHKRFIDVTGKEVFSLPNCSGYSCCVGGVYIVGLKRSDSEDSELVGVNHKGEIVLRAPKGWALHYYFEGED